MEAWTQKGISTIASSLGRPIIMDAMTTKMCHQGAEKYGFARVLVEVNDVQGCQDSIVLQYYDENKVKLQRKTVFIEYTWKLNVCNFCKVFGHSILNCQKRPRSDAEIKLKNKEKVDTKPAQKTVEKAVDVLVKDNVKSQSANMNGTKDNNKEKVNKEGKKRKGESNGKVWNLSPENKEALKQSANKYAILQNKDDNEYLNEFPILLSPQKKQVVESFISNKINPNDEEFKKWSNEMKTYFKEKWQDNEKEDKEDNSQKNTKENVYEDYSEIENFLAKNEVLNKNKNVLFEEASAGIFEISNQSMFCLIEDVNNTFRMLCTFVYAKNDGDFNVTLRIDEHSAGMSCSSADMIEFQECISRIEVKDLNKTGCHFTWTKSLKNLDTVSDHSLAVMIILKIMKKKNRAFRFSNYLSEKEEFIPLVKQSWDGNVEGYKMYVLVQKLKRLEKVLKKMSWKNGNLTDRVAVLKEELRMVQIKSIDNVHDAELRKEAADKLKEYNEAVNDELKLLYQLAKVEWDTESIENKTDLFTQQVTVQEAAILCKDVTNQEIKEALKSIDDNKAPGPHGYTTRFFKAAWDIIGSYVQEAIKEFFQKGKMLGETNATMISQVPKIKTPAKVSDFRPIACCNVIYKMISKILTNRIKGVLCRIVSQNQSAFIHGKSITDNILLTQELLKGYSCKHGKQRCAFKIDIMKAYENVCWNFLEEALKGFGFPLEFIEWVMVCIRTAGFSICVNGKSCGYFKGGRGSRQGDLISPYLFTIVMELINLFIQRKIIQQGNFKYHTGCEELKITNLCFADDLLILCNSDCDSVKIIKLGLEEFSLVSGLVPNLGKSTMFCSNISEDLKKKILEIVPFAVGILLVRYLGVPLVTRRLNVKDCKSFVDKVKRKVGDWKNKFLSYAGRMQLIAFVLSAMQTYWAFIFFLPKTIINEIDSILKSFLWSQGEKVSRRAKYAWKNVCKPK
ncbi:RNA-directed DNA polymerase, eukaryota, reverse transcriptase zinc-binding domain protein [Tanacetum coccineum]